MRREPSANDIHHRGLRSLQRAQALQVSARQRHAPVIPAVSELGRETLGRGACVRKVPRVELFGAVFGWVLGLGHIIWVWVRAGDEDGA